MDRIRLACYGLIASAFVLAGLLFVSLDGRLNSTAEADMLIARNNFTLMTARTRDGVESLFLLDNSTGRLLIYTLDGRDLKLGANVELARIFERAAGGAAGGNRRGR